MNDTPERSGTGEEFRDSLGIITTEGGRRWVFPRAPAGRFHRARIVLSAFLLLVLFGIPFLTVKDHPFILFNILERKLILFGTVFGPHDFYLVGLAAITVIVFIILFTVVFGRLFCGWVCPQTLFMEMVFRKIDYWIEGDHRAQRRLREQPWNRAKLARKAAKYLLYAVIAFLIANTLLAYIIGVGELARLVREPPGNHPGTFGAVIGFSAVFYWIFIWFREQACILVCPYGRLQGVLLDRNSTVIAYDHVRGEPRGRFRRNRDTAVGDCIDCRRCVEVCPTGIDIRNGTQLECVNCTACIDACDTVMDAVRRPRGLVRYSSAAAIAGATPFRWTGRVAGYAAALLALIAALTYLLAVRTPLEVTILRTPGMLFQEQPDGRISNVYDLKVMNKTFAAVSISVRLLAPDGEVQMIGDSPLAGPQDVVESKMLVYLSPSAITSMSTPLSFGIYADTILVQTFSTTFLGPVRRR